VCVCVSVSVCMFCVFASVVRLCVFLQVSFVLVLACRAISSVDLISCMFYLNGELEDNSHQVH